MKKFWFFFCFLMILNAGPKPQLVVFLVVDQAQPGLLHKYDTLFSGGFRWLKDNGIEFSQVYHEHGYTATGPGHFALATGQYPGNGGVLGNWWFDRTIGKSWYCVEDSTARILSDDSFGRSYRFVSTPGLGDWLKQANLESKVFSISGKDRAAVFLGGKNCDLSLWYDKHGSWTSSTFYVNELPSWVVDFNAGLNVSSYANSVWNRLLDQEIYEKFARPDFFKGEVDISNQNQYSPTLPLFYNMIPVKDLIFWFYGTYWGDRAVLDLSEIAIKENLLGADENTDIIFISLSGTDGIGHDFGPNSQEQLDNYLRLDRKLGNFISFVERKVGTGKTFYVLSSDHGAIALPEYLQKLGLDTGRIHKPSRDSLYTLIRAEIDSLIGKNMVTRYGNSFYFVGDLSEQQQQLVLNIVKKHMFKLNGIREVLTKTQILSNGGTDTYSLRLKNMIHEKKSADIFLIIKKYWTWRWPQGSGHGSPYDYDAHVPLIFARSGWQSTVIQAKAATIDIAPTVANYIDIALPSSKIDGKVLKLPF
ncbi:MAG: alkaline phosphatase family protein [Candidatus Neomarinimicrobiota bacterium]